LTTAELSSMPTFLPAIVGVRSADAAGVEQVSLDPSRRIAGWVHTNGTRLVDQRGRTVRFTGVGLRDLEAGSGTMAPARQPGVIRLCRDGWSISPRQVFDQIASFGFNTVRVAVTWANLEPTAPTGGVHHWNESYLRAVD